MQDKCKQAVAQAAQALGRKIPTAKQFEAIETELSASMRNLARRDPSGWQSLTRDQQMNLAAKSVMEDIKAAADRKLANAERQILRVAETDQRIKALQDSFKDTKGHSGTRAEALKRDFELTHIGIAGERKIAQAGMMDLITAAANKKGETFGQKILMTVFNSENRLMTKNIIAEIYKNADGHTGNEEAKMAARAWLDTIEGLRTRFNAAGGDVGKLEYGYAPQPHDTSKVRKAGVDAWVEKTAPLLDRKRYLNDDGSLMSNTQVRDFLREAYETLKTEGLNKSEPGQFQGTGARANRGGDSRQIHFADGEAWSQYMQAYGKGTIYDAMMAHVGGMTRDIGLVERYGPDASANARLQFDLVKREDPIPTTGGEKAASMFRTRPETYWDMVSGKVGAPVNETLANTASMLRNFQTGAKLGGALISSVTDLGTLVMNTSYNKLPYWQLVKDIGSQASKETREWMASNGMISESAANEINRWSGDHIGTNWSGRIANTVLKASLLNAWTDGLRQGFTLSMNAGLAKMAKKDWGALEGFDRSRLTRAGITESDWKVLNGIAPDNFNGRELLTPQAIKASGHEQANTIAAKVFGFIHDESEYAVVNPDLEARARITWGGQQAGTAAGELARTVNQFKSFPIAMVTRHWARMLDGDHDAQGAPKIANRAVYSFALMATATGLGAVAVQEKQILAGKDPIDMNKGRFWLKALAQGGGLSIAGDVFLVDPASSSTDAATTLAKNLVGPAIGSASELVLKNITENIWQASEGKDSHWEAELFSWAKAQTPGGNLWWMKPFVEHGFTNAINESLSPGYLSRVQSRSQKDFGQRYWYAPQDKLPARGPDLSAALP